MGCPYFGGCRGYELMNDLDFDTDGDGSTHSNGVGDADDDYNNGGAGWLPIHSTHDWAGRATSYGKYTGEFHGRGHVIANLYINRVYFNYASLFAQLGRRGKVIGVGLRNPVIQSASGTVGPLVGLNEGLVAASYSRGGSVSARTNVGGLVGANSVSGRIVASYATTAVECTASGPWRGAGGLVASAGAGVTASYAIGAVTESAGLAPPGCPHRAGLALGRAAVTASYWNSDTTTPIAANPGGTGKTTAELQSPTAYGAGANDIYKDWNVDVDGDGAADDPWDFGTSSQYPALKYGGFVPAFQGRPTDYDDDNDGLIDIRNLAQLDAVRYDLDGQGDQDSVSAANWAKYQKAFPNPIAGMGCQLADHDGDSATDEQPTCTGYELRRDLDFDTNGNGKTHTDGAGDAGDDYYHSGSGWDPIGSHGNPYTAEFNGRGYVIANLYLARNRNYTGLFTQLGSTGKIIGVGLRDPLVKDGQGTVGPLVGLNDGLVAASYSRGGSVAANTNVGGLVGANNNASGRIVASYATTAVDCKGVGGSYSGGGLVAGPGLELTASYATGAVTGNCVNKAGLTNGSAAVSSSYWQTRSPDLTGSDPGGVSKAASALQGPACYTGDYAEWNVDVDGDGAADQPWYFGGNTDYPALRYGGHQVTKQGITARLAELSGLGIAPGQVYGDFLHCPTEYRAVAGPAVTEITVSPTAADGVTPTYQDGNDATLVDSNGVAAGQQTPLAAGENTVKVTVATGRSYVLKVERAVVPTVTGTAQKSTTWATRNGSLDSPAQLSGSTREAQTLTFSVDDSNSQSPTASGYWATMQVWLCTTQTVENTQPTAAAGCVNAGIMSNPTPDDTADDNNAQVSATVTAAQAANGGVVVKVWDNTSGSAALQLAQWLPIRLADDAALRGLEIATTGGLLLPPFAPSRHSYTYYPPAGAAAITATATANHPGATVAYSGTDADGSADGHQLPVGSAAGAVSSFDVTVTAADGTTQQQYAVTIGTGVAPGLVIAPSPLVVRDGGNGSYTVALNQAPSAAVTVNISRQTRTGGAVGEAQIRVGSTGNWETAATLEFTTENWNTPQTVSVQAPADADTTDEADTFTHRVAVAATNAAEYRGVAADLTVDIKEPGIILSATGNLKVDEGASAAVAYTVKLKAPPSAAVTVTVSRDTSLGEVQFSATAAGTYADSLELTFTTENWNTAQTVYVKAGEDNDDTDDTGDITHTAGATGGYTASATATRPVTVEDNDDAGLVINPSPLSLNEGSNATYTVRLVTQPTANVTVAIERQTGGDNAVAFHIGGTGATYSDTSKTLTFTNNNWKTPQTVYVRAAADSDSDNERDVLTHTMTDSSDTVYRALTAEELTVNVADTVSAGLSVSPDTLPATPGSRSSYNIRLTAPPAADVTVTPASDNSAVTIESTPLTFTDSNWNEAQQVTVMAAADATTDTTATVSHTLSSTDTNYNEQTFTDGNVMVKIVAAASGGGGVGLGGSGGGGSGGGGGGLGGGGGSAGAAPAAPPPGIEFSVASVALDEGMAAAYRVRMSGPPGAAAMVTITSSSSDLIATPDTLDFTDAWEQWQTVLITAARDRNGRDATARLTHRGPEGSRGVLEVSIADIWPEAVTRTVNGHTLTVTYTQDAPYGVRATAPDTLAADATVTVSAAPEDTPPTPLAYGLGDGSRNGNRRRRRRADHLPAGGSGAPRPYGGHSSHPPPA